MTEDRYCIDCKWFSKAFENGGTAECWHDKSKFLVNPVDLVFGPKSDEGFHLARRMREAGRECSPDGFLFEPKEAK